MKNRLVKHVCGATLLCLIAVAHLARAQTFTDVTASADVGGANGNSAGIAFADYNNDGYLDIYVANQVDSGWARNMLFKNQGAGAFLDVERTLEVADPGHGHGVAFGDYDNDGDLDIYISNHFGGDSWTNRLYQNDLYETSSEGFTDVTSQAGVADANQHSAAAVWGDYNGDGWLDMYVTNHHPPGRMCCSTMTVTEPLPTWPQAKVWPTRDTPRAR